MRCTDLHSPVFRAFLCFLVEVGCKSMSVVCKPFPKSENFFAFHFLHCRLFMVEVVGGHLQTFLCERNFYFFSPCVKYVFDFLRPPPPSFSGFFVLFGGSRMQVDVGRLQTFPKSENFFACSLFCTAVFSLVTVGDGHFHTFYIEKNFYFFSRVRKVYI